MRNVLLVVSGLLGASAVAVVLALTLFRDEVEHKIADGIQAAVGIDLEMIAAVASEVSLGSQEHSTFACEESGSYSQPDDFVKALGLPDGNWVVTKRFQAGDSSYVLVQDIDSGPTGRGGKSATVGTGKNAILCFVST
jgi:hypothetical protein